MGNNQTTNFNHHQRILVTGGTGTLGTAIVVQLLTHMPDSKVIVFSRDEYKQWVMARELSNYKQRLEFIIGDVRDQQSISKACQGINTVFHCAALKQIENGERFTEEFRKTNIEGSRNVLSACITNGVEQLLGISSDKACLPISEYGRTKKAMENLFTASSNNGITQVRLIRLGNLLNSRGSVFEVIANQGFGSGLRFRGPNASRFLVHPTTAAKQCINTAFKLRHFGIVFFRHKSFKVQTLAEIALNTNNPTFHPLLSFEKDTELLYSPIENGKVYSINLEGFDNGYFYTPNGLPPIKQQGFVIEKATSFFSSNNNQNLIDKQTMQAILLGEVIEII